MTRRRLLAIAGNIAAAGYLRGAGSRIGKNRISPVTDRIAISQADAVSFARSAGLEWVELRTVPGSAKEFAALTEPELKRYAAELAGAKLKVSVLNTSIPPLQKDRQTNELGAALQASRVLGSPILLIGTGSREGDPGAVYPQLVDAIQKLSRLAQSVRVRIAVENEPGSNTATSSELKQLLDMINSPSVGANWRPESGSASIDFGSRLLNVRAQADDVEGPQSLNWKGIMEALARNNYQGQIGVDAPADAPVAGTQDAVRGLLHIAGQL